MKKIYLVCLVAVYLLSGCQGKSTHSHEDHEHHHSELEEHHHHDHEHEGHDHEHEAEAHAAGEIVFKKEKAEAIGLQTEDMTPSVFAEVLKTSGQVQEAQGSESFLVATIPGVVS